MDTHVQTLTRRAGELSGALMRVTTGDCAQMPGLIALIEEGD